MAEILAYTQDGQVFCVPDCDPIANGAENPDDFEPVFVSHGMDAGTLCDGCDLVLNEDNEWVEPPPPATALTMLKEAIDDDKGS